MVEKAQLNYLVPLNFRVEDGTVYVEQPWPEGEELPGLVPLFSSSEVVDPGEEPEAAEVRNNLIAALFTLTANRR